MAISDSCDSVRHICNTCVSALALFIFGALATAPAAMADWKPEKAVELIVPSGPGSGLDATARAVQTILQTNKLIETPLSIVNKPGGSFGVGLSYLSQFPGDGHRLFIQTATPLSALLTGQLKIGYFEFTPLANLVSEPIAFAVRADSPIQNGKDLAQRIKAHPGSLSIALAAARGNSYHITAALLARSVAADIKKLKIVVFGSSGDMIPQLLGGHVDVMLGTPGNLLSLFEAKKVRIISVASPQRLTGPLAAVPTLKDQGFDVVFDNPRSVLGPKGLTAEQVRYWEGVLQRLVKTDAWKQALERNRWDDNYMDGAELARSLKTQYMILKDVLGELGMIKQ